MNINGFSDNSGAYEKKSHKKAVILIIGISALLIVAIFVTRYFLTKPVEVDLNKYIKIEYNGYDTMGTAVFEFDYDSFYHDYKNKIKVVKSEKKAVSQISREVLDSEDSNACAILYNAYIDVSLDRTENLSNGESINLTWNCNEKLALKYFNVKLKYSNKEYVLNNFKEVQMVDPFENVTVTFDGYSGEGIATIENNSDEKELANLVYTINKEKNLKNGMEVKLTVTDKSGESPVNEMLEKYGIYLTSVEKVYKVNGLKAVNEIDAFQYITVEFEGANGLGIPVVTNTSSNEELQDIKLQFSKSEKLANHDKVTVTITDADGNNPNKELADKYGVRIQTLSKTFEVDGLKEYATKASEIPQETMDAMKKQAEDMINAYTAKEYHSREKESETLLSLTYVGNYFFNLKDGYNENTKDFILLVYKANVNMVKTYYNFNENTDIYYAVVFENLYMNDDGTIYIDVAKGKLSGKTAQIFYTPSYAISFANAYETLDFLKKDRVTPKLEKYTIEENIITQ